MDINILMLPHDPRRADVGRRIPPIAGHIVRLLLLMPFLNLLLIMAMPGRYHDTHGQTPSEIDPLLSTALPTDSRRANQSHFRGSGLPSRRPVHLRLTKDNSFVPLPTSELSLLYGIFLVIYNACFLIILARGAWRRGVLGD